MKYHLQATIISMLINKATIVNSKKWVFHIMWNRSHNLSGDMYWFTTWIGIEVTTWVVICTDLPHDLESKSQLEWWYVLIYHMTWNRSHNFNGDMYWFTTWPGIEVTTWVVICTDLLHNLESKSQLQWWYVLIYHMTWNRSHNLSSDMYRFTTWPGIDDFDSRSCDKSVHITTQVVTSIPGHVVNQYISPLKLWLRFQVMW
jgi:hypothetical protein